MSISNGGPEIQIGLTREQAEFLKKNCDKNIAFALNYMMNAPKCLTADDRAHIEDLVSITEQFKAIRSITVEALK